MGNFEKLVVLTVLFVTAVVLAVSMLGGGGEELPAGPLGELAAEPGSGGPLRSGSTPPREEALRTADVSLAGGRAARDLLLDSSLRTEPAPPPAPAAAPAAGAGPARILVDETGLRAASFGTDYLVYTVAAGDTWIGLAQRFYRDTRHVGLLHSANEEMDAPVEGEEVLVPVFDLAREAGIRAPLRPREIVARPLDSAPAAGPGSAAASDAAAGAATAYEVVAGDNLSKISAKVYGTANRWKEIYDANRDVLDRPDWVQIGMRLRIPR
ncbi:MAG: LysM peptidoglycan-binding domain-containing protein [Planctomycetota bacterium]